MKVFAEYEATQRGAEKATKYVWMVETALHQTITQYKVQGVLQKGEAIVVRNYIMLRICIH